MDNIVGGRCSVSLITQLRRCIFSKNKNIFRYLKLEILLAIPVYNSNNSAGQGLTIDSCLCFNMEKGTSLRQTSKLQHF